MRYLGIKFETYVPVSSLGLTGGTAGKVVRYDSSTVVVDADNTDTQEHLHTVLFKTPAGEYVGEGIVTGLSGLTEGAAYFLGTSGDITSTAPTPSATVCSLLVGVALSATTLLFRPGVPIVGA